MVIMHKVTALFLLSPCKQTEMCRSVNSYEGGLSLAGTTPTIRFRTTCLVSKVVILWW